MDILTTVAIMDTLTTDLMLTPIPPSLVKVPHSNY
jgi:hypothetical protein